MHHHHYNLQNAWPKCYQNYIRLIFDCLLHGIWKNSVRCISETDQQQQKMMRTETKIVTNKYNVVLLCMIISCERE